MATHTTLDGAAVPLGSPEHCYDAYRRALLPTSSPAWQTLSAKQKQGWTDARVAAATGALVDGGGHAVGVLTDPAAETEGLIGLLGYVVECLDHPLSGHTSGHRTSTKSLAQNAAAQLAADLADLQG